MSRQNDTSVIPLIFELELLFGFFNQQLFENALSKPVITVMQDTTSGAYGWCTTGKIWTNANTKEGHHEINICAEYLNRPLYETAETLLHEMIHLYNAENGVKDCSRGGTYHNAKFKCAAEAHGLVVTQDTKYSYCRTKLNEDTKKLLKGYKGGAFALHRTAAIKPEKGKAKSSTRKYICPNCGASVRATKEVNIVC